MYYRLLTISLFSLVAIVIIGCSSPSDQEIISSVSNSIDQDSPSPCYAFKPSNLKVDKIGYNQTSDSINWWPVRVKATGKCLKTEGPVLRPALFPDELTDKTFEEEGVDTTIIVEYRLQKNEYGEWEAVLRN